MSPGLLESLTLPLPIMPSSTSLFAAFRGILSATVWGGASAFAASSPAVVTDIAPRIIQAEGGIPVTLTGQGLSSATAVIIGGVEVMDLQVIDDETLVVLTSADMNAYEKDVVIRTPQGTCTVTGMLSMDPVQQGMEDPMPDPMPDPTPDTTGNPLQSGGQTQGLISGNSIVTEAAANHLFTLNAGPAAGGTEDASGTLNAGVTEGEGDGEPNRSPEARFRPGSTPWKVYSSVNYGNVKLNAVGGQAGVQVDSWAPSIGIDRQIAPGLIVGFAASFLHSEQGYTGSRGHLQLEGPALSAYLSYVRGNHWNSLLYNFGIYDLNSTRSPGLAFPLAYGSSRTYTHAIQYNTGWNFRFQDDTLVTGPFVGIDYLHGSINAYRESGGGLGALAYGRQGYESLVTRVGWALSKKLKTSWGAITPQGRLSYERQNLRNNGTSATFINVPLTSSGSSQQPGQDYLVAAAGLQFNFTERFSLLFNYQGQFFRQDMQAHFGGVRLSYQF